MRWLGLGDIQAVTGEYEVRDQRGDRIRSSAHLFRGGDILFSRLRPKLRKVVRVPEEDEGGFCSSELLVLRLRPAARRLVLADYLAYVLRSSLVFGQLIYQVTGVGRPRVTLDAVRELTIPTPSREEQQAVIDALASAHASSRRVRAEALRQLDSATAAIEEAYEGTLRRLLSGPGADGTAAEPVPQMRAG